ncbi:DNA topoisomerase III [Pokkaliibacter plantistimulans]|uniref:DNA topoisomerase n=1 Tax=Pokkaliibacter plantistimulans TaxID=1635171 RepID=A0ABX5LVT5_9GAMM|nr:DNA topoisomerase III [Pokkaliibacter plantistimulans]PXF30451.1 DNA topoisomerase III [Pokkaliibacter plantistimulans]
MQLILCEKPSQAKEIASLVGASKRGEGCLLGNGVIVTWCIGHLLRMAEPDELNPDWAEWRLEQLPMIPSEWTMRVDRDKAKQFKAIKSLLSQATSVVIATDAGREGEMIAREILEHCNWRKGPVHRLWTSSQDEATLRKALASLLPGASKEPLYWSALARSRADYIVGMNMTRLYSLLAKQQGYQGVLSVGRVQTPTLALVVARDREIARFVSKPFFDVVITSAGGHGRTFAAQWLPVAQVADEEGRCINGPIAQQLAARLRGQAAQVASVEVKRVREQPPLPFSLSALQQVCDRKFGFGVQQTLDIAQSLYEKHKATTYPRSDCRYLPVAMLDEVKPVLQALAQSDPSLGPLVMQLDSRLRSSVWNDEKVNASDHHAIIPTMGVIDLSAMTEDERRVYELIRLHYLMQFMPAHEYDRTEVMLVALGQQFKAVGKVVAVAGWRALMVKSSASASLSADGAESDEAENSDAGGQELPPLEQGHVCPVTDAQVVEKKTTPPKFFTQGTLIAAMKGIARYVADPRLKAKLSETSGIGTEATRAAIIEGLIKRGFLLSSKRSVRSTDAAQSLIDALPQPLTDPGTTALWEQALSAIEQGQLTLDQFVATQAQWITHLVHEAKQAGRGALQIAATPTQACPLCSAPMRKRSGANGPFWGCTRYPECKGVMDGGGKKKRTRKKAEGAT